MSVKLTTELCKTASLAGTRVELDLHSVDSTVNLLWNPLWKLVSRGYWPQKFGTSSKNTSLDEQSNKFSVKDLIHHHKCYYLGSKISSISESKLASTDRKVKQSPVFKPDWRWGCRGNGILGIKPLNCYILFVRFLNLSCNSDTFYTMEYCNKDKNGVYSCS